MKDHTNMFSANSAYNRKNLSNQKFNENQSARLSSRLSRANLNLNQRLVAEFDRVSAVSRGSAKSNHSRRSYSSVPMNKVIEEMNVNLQNQ